MKKLLQFFKKAFCKHKSFQVIDIYVGEEKWTDCGEDSISFVGRGKVKRKCLNCQNISVSGEKMIIRNKMSGVCQVWN